MACRKGEPRCLARMMSRCKGCLQARGLVSKFNRTSSRRTAIAFHTGLDRLYQGNTGFILIPKGVAPSLLGGLTIRQAYKEHAMQCSRKQTKLSTPRPVSYEPLPSTCTPPSILSCFARPICRAFEPVATLHIDAIDECPLATQI